MNLKQIFRSSQSSRHKPHNFNTLNPPHQIKISVSPSKISRLYAKLLYQQEDMMWNNQAEAMTLSLQRSQPLSNETAEVSCPCGTQLRLENQEYTSLKYRLQEFYQTHQKCLERTSVVSLPPVTEKAITALPLDVRGTEFTAQEIQEFLQHRPLDMDHGLVGLSSRSALAGLASQSGESIPVQGVHLNMWISPKAVSQYSAEAPVTELMGCLIDFFSKNELIRWRLNDYAKSREGVMKHGY